MNMRIKMLYMVMYVMMIKYVILMMNMKCQKAQLIMFMLKIVITYVQDTFAVLFYYQIKTVVLIFPHIKINI